MLFLQVRKDILQVMKVPVFNEKVCMMFKPWDLSGHVYFVLHQKRTTPRKGFEIGFCKEGWHDFHGGDLSVVVRKGSYVEGIGLCHISIGRVDGGW